MTEATYQSATDCPLGQAHGTASTHGNAKGETCCDFCGFPVDHETTEATPVAMEVWQSAFKVHGVIASLPPYATETSPDQAAAAVIATALADMQRRVEVFRQIGRWEMAWEIAFQLEQPLIDCTEGKPEQASFDTAAKMLSMSIAGKASRAFSDLPLEVQFGEGEWAEVIESARQALSDKTQRNDDV